MEIVVAGAVVKKQQMAISALAMMQRLKIVSSEEWLKNQVQKIVLSDKEALKEEKIDEWTHGLRPDGSIIGTYRDPEYAYFKQQVNPLASGNVDLLLTRETANSLFVTPASKGFIFRMNDRHNLIGKYGNEILGLNQEWFNNRQRDIYRYVLMQDLKKILNK